MEPQSERHNHWPGSAGEHLLQERHGTGERAHRFYSQQVLDHLNERMREFVADQEMMFVATADSRGECDCTFRAGPPGFVQVLSPTRLAWPEYRGNGVSPALGNVTENPHVGMLFVDFFRRRDRAARQRQGAARRRRRHPHGYRDLPADQAPGRRPERWVVGHRRGGVHPLRQAHPAAAQAAPRACLGYRRHPPQGRRLLRRGGWCGGRPAGARFARRLRRASRSSRRRRWPARRSKVGAWRLTDGGYCGPRSSLVLAVSLGASAVYAAVSLLAKLTAGEAARAADGHAERVPGAGPALAGPHVPAARHRVRAWCRRCSPSTCWPVTRTSRRTVRLGLDRPRPGFDLGAGAGLAAVIGIPGLGLYLLARARRGQRHGGRLGAAAPCGGRYRSWCCPPSRTPCWRSSSSSGTC